MTGLKYWVSMMKKIKTLTIADPVSGFDPAGETTSFILGELCERGHEVWVTELKNLFWSEGVLYADAQKVLVQQKEKKFTYKIVGKRRVRLKNFSAIFLRKDPPVDEAYINHLHLLQILELSKGAPLFINSPTGIKKSSEKLYPFYFPGISPPSIVSAGHENLWQFIKKHKKVVLKPLNEGGGRGVRLLSSRDCGRTHRSAPTRINGLFVGVDPCVDPKNQFVILQKYLPEIKAGDKRILLFNGKILGSFVRIPKKGDFRGNMHAGASWKKSDVTAAEKKIIKKITPQLRIDGLLFVGLDFIGGKITEINTTSPMGIREINTLHGLCVEKNIVDYLESTCA